MGCHGNTNETDKNITPTFFNHYTNFSLCLCPLEFVHGTVYCQAAVLALKCTKTLTVFPFFLSGGGDRGGVEMGGGESNKCFKTHCKSTGGNWHLIKRYLKANAGVSRTSLSLSIIIILSRNSKSNLQPSAVGETCIIQPVSRFQSLRLRLHAEFSQTNSGPPKKTQVLPLEWTCGPRLMLLSRLRPLSCVSGASSGHQGLCQRERVQPWREEHQTAASKPTHCEERSSVFSFHSDHWLLIQRVNYNPPITIKTRRLD